VRSITRQLSRSGTKVSRAASTGAASIKHQFKAAKTWWSGAQVNTMTFSPDLLVGNDGRGLLFVELSQGDREILKQFSDDIAYQVRRLCRPDGSLPAVEKIVLIVQAKQEQVRSALSADGQTALYRFETKQRLHDLKRYEAMGAVEYRLRLANLSNDCMIVAGKDGRQLIG
jgi:hypothetical protein